MNTEENQLNSCATPSESESRKLLLREKAREAERRYRERNRERVNAMARARHAANPEPFREAVRKWRARNPEAEKGKWKEYYKNNREELIKKRMAWAKRNPEKVRATRRRKYQRHKDKILASNLKWRTENQDKHRQTQSAYVKNRRADDHIYKLACQLRARVSTALRKQYAIKCKKTMDLIGCTPQFLKSYLEAKFQHGMTWENHGPYWQIDHIIPLSKFNLCDPDEQRMGFHYSNCQPLVRSENIRKSDTMPGPHQAILI